MERLNELPGTPYRRSSREKPIPPVRSDQEQLGSKGLSTHYYKEVREVSREVSIIPEGSRSESEMPIGVGPGLCGILNSDFGEQPFHDVR
jgi:hypothetical protein